MRLYHQAIYFLLASFAISAVIYGSALWGARMLAPLDIGPNLFTNYHYMDPAANGVPDNHYIIDQFNYDLPLQNAIYRSYHEGEIPWWDPYTYGGRPLLADAHINGTDPIRLACYALLPFELAYNWNYVLRGILTGLGMFLLVRELGVSAMIAGILAVTYQYAGWFTMFWGHPWIQGSFIYFPYIWMFWLRALHSKPWLHIGLSGLLCGLVFCSGNLQSHLNLPLFALAFLAAAFVKAPGQFLLAFRITALSGIIGALLAAPLLANQVEYFLLSARSLESGGSGSWYLRLLAIPFSAGSFYPWMFGTFKTLDVERVANMNGVAFLGFCGIAVTSLATWGCWALRRTKGLLGIAVCQSVILLIIYIVVVSTPLANLLYGRCAPLGGMGLMVAAALTAQAIIDRKILPSRRLVRSMIVLMVATSISSSALAWWVYPMFKARIERIVLGTESPSLVNAPKLRRNQLDRFPSEVSLRNPEIVLTLAAAGLLAFALTRREKVNLHSAMAYALMASALPVLAFHTRFSPSQPIELWHRYVEGGPAQKSAKELLAGGLRLDESTMPPADLIFPFAAAAMHHVHVLHGYSALQPRSLHVYPPHAPQVPESWRADVLAQSAEDASRLPTFIKTSTSARFRLQSSGEPAPVRITAESHNRLTLEIPPLPVGEAILRTDTYYPGWTLRDSHFATAIAKQNICFSVIPLPRAGGTLQLEYSPRWQIGRAHV